VEIGLCSSDSYLGYAYVEDGSMTKEIPNQPICSDRNPEMGFKTRNPVVLSGDPE
jgi:hypothetical protein